MISPIKQIEELNKRLEKAREIVAAGKVYPVLGMEDHFAVEASDGKGFYLVNGTCTCPDAQNRTDIHKGWCKHKLSVELYKELKPASYLQCYYCKQDFPELNMTLCLSCSCSFCPECTDNSEHSSRCAAQTEAEATGFQRYHKHYVPGDAPLVKNNRPLEEQVNDLFG